MHSEGRTLNGDKMTADGLLHSRAMDANAAEDGKDQLLTRSPIDGLDVLDAISATAGDFKTLAVGDPFEFPSLNAHSIGRHSLGHSPLLDVPYKHVLAESTTIPPLKSSHFPNLPSKASKQSLLNDRLLSFKNSHGAGQLRDSPSYASPKQEVDSKSFNLASTADIGAHNAADPIYYPVAGKVRTSNPVVQPPFKKEVAITPRTSPHPFNILPAHGGWLETQNPFDVHQWHTGLKEQEAAKMRAQ